MKERPKNKYVLGRIRTKSIAPFTMLALVNPYRPPMRQPINDWNMKKSRCLSRHGLSEKIIHILLVSFVQIHVKECIFMGYYYIVPFFLVFLHRNNKITKHF